MNRDVLDKQCERGILGLVLAILVFGPLATGGVRTQDFLVIQGLTLGVMLLWLIRLWLKPRPQLLWPPICWAVLAFAAYAVGRYLTADIEYVAREDMVRTLVYTFLFLAILNNLHRQEYTQLITFTLVFLAMGIAAYALYQFITDSDKVWMFTKPYKHRGSGTFISPNNLAGFLEMIFPLGLAGMLVSRAKPLTKVFVGYASLVILAGIGVTLSRGSWVSTGIVLMVFLAILFTRRAYQVPSIVLLVLLVGLGLCWLPRAHFFQARVKELTVHGQFNDSARFDLWIPAVRLWQENVWWGIGPNHYNYRFRQYRPQTEQRQPDRVHNDYLNTLTDWGIVGAVLVAAAIVLLYAGVARTWSFVRGTPGDLGSSNSNKFSLLLGTSLGVLAILLHSFVDFNMHIPANAILAISLMAMLSGSLRFTSDRHWLSARIGIKSVATVLLLGGAGYLSWEGIRMAREQVWLSQARQAAAYSPVQIATLEKAFAAEPKNFETAFALGEAYRKQSWEGGSNEAELGRKAMVWYDRSTKLNPYDGYGYLNYGMCLDWAEQFEEASHYFDKAVKLDPNGYFTAAWVGWHYVQTGDYAAAKAWLERSKQLEWNDNLIADTYLSISNKKLLEAASKASPGAPSR